MHETVDIFTEQRHLGEWGERLWRRAAALGAAALVVSAGLAVVTPEGWRRFLFAYLINYAFLVSLALGALFFVVLQHLTRAGWSVVVRRLAEGVAATLPALGVLLVPLLVGMPELYHWTHGDIVAADPILQGKQGYLNAPFFVARMVVYFAIWSWLARFFLRTSTIQDAGGDAALSLAMQRRSAPAMVLFALTVTFFAFDLLMSLDPHWFSTIFGVYVFAGGVVGFLALLILAVAACQRWGFLRRAVTIEHYHDLGKLLFAFVVFWAYIAFSQYMLIWYADIPEETGWYLRRTTGAWGWVGLALLLGHFLVPFGALLSRWSKRRRTVLVAASLWLLAMHWLDLFWLVLPEASASGVPVNLMDLTLLLGLGSLFLAAAVFVLRRHALVPERDPRLDESLNFENA